MALPKELREKVDTVKAILSEIAAHEDGRGTRAAALTEIDEAVQDCLDLEWEDEIDEDEIDWEGEEDWDDDEDEEA